MVSTDTVVGIVGAGLLAAVMVGVFLYEYNNTGDALPIDGDGDGRPDPAALFAQRYPMLNATGDLDNDGTPNLEDADMDQDGLNNTDDGEVRFTTASQGAIGPALPPAVSPEVFLEFMVETGVERVTASVTVTSPQPHNLLVQLLGPGGAVMDDASSTAGSPSSFSLDAGEAPEVGTYRVRVTQNPAGAGASVNLGLTADYGTPVQPTTPSDIGA